MMEISPLDDQSINVAFDRFPFHLNTSWRVSIVPSFGTLHRYRRM